MSRSSSLDPVAPDINFSSTQSVISDDHSYQQRLDDILGHTRHPLSAFLAHPKIFTFEEKDEHEDILLVLRQHWFTNVNWILTAVFMFLAPSLLRLTPLLASFPQNYQMVSIIFWYLVTVTFVFEKFLSWYFNVYIITTQRVVDIDFTNLLNKRFTEAELKNIQDVTSRVSGLSQTMFNYGIILIQTAAEIPEIVFRKIPNPEKVIELLQELRDRNQGGYHA